MDRENVRRKLKGLLAVAAHDSGATPGERDTARALADRLMREHGLTEAEVADPVPQDHLAFTFSSGYYQTEGAVVVFSMDTTY